MSCWLDAFRVDFVGDCTKLCAAMLRFSSIVTDLGLPDRGRSATVPVCSNILFKLWIACWDGGTLFGKRSTNKSTTSLWLWSCCHHFWSTRTRSSVITSYSLYTCSQIHHK
jgi:hypothetical protein